jgi:hypothetical protein
MNQIRELIHAAINTFLHNPNQFASGGLFLMAIGAIGATPPTSYIPTAGPNATVRGVSDGIFMFEDMITGPPNLYILTLQWNTYGHWVMGAAAFRM